MEEHYICNVRSGINCMPYTYVFKRTGAIQITEAWRFRGSICGSFCLYSIQPAIRVWINIYSCFYSRFLFGIIYLIIILVLDRQGGGSINHSAHIWGAFLELFFFIIASKLFSDYPVSGSLCGICKKFRSWQNIYNSLK